MQAWADYLDALKADATGKLFRLSKRLLGRQLARG